MAMMESQPPTASASRTRSVWSELKFGVQTAGMVTRFFFRLLVGIWFPRASVADLKFPLLAMQTDASITFFETAEALKEMPPDDGTILIDADFKQYELANVRLRQGELSMIFRWLVPTRRPLTYKFDLKRRRKTGLAAAIKVMAGTTRSEAIARETTVPKMIARMRAAGVK